MSRRSFKRPGKKRKAVVYAASGGVPCPGYGSQRSEVIDSRAVRQAPAVRRRRVCMTCAHRFTTYEVCKAASDFGQMQERMNGLAVKLEETIQLFNEAQEWLRLKQLAPAEEGQG